jgi:hypothetical protein
MDLAWVWLIVLVVAIAVLYGLGFYAARSYDRWVTSQE